MDLSGLTDNFFPTAQPGFTTTADGEVASGAASVVLAGTGDYEDGDIVTLTIDPADANKKQVFTGVMDLGGSQVTEVEWTEGTNQIHAAGATIADYTSATHISQVSKGIKVAHNDDGTLKDSVFASIWPVGTFYMNASNSANPNTYLPGMSGTTWVAVEDRVIIGAGNLYAAGATGGAATVQLTTTELPAHTHGDGTLATASDNHSHTIPNNIFKTSSSTSGLHVGAVDDASWGTDSTSSDSHTHNITGSTASAGSGSAFSILNPYYGAYVWRRTA